MTAGAFEQATLASMEQMEVESLRLRMDDDRILDITVGKTAIMILQEHCHKHVGKPPSYSECHAAGSTKGTPVFQVTVSLYDGVIAKATDLIKKRAKHKAALTCLRELYPHVELWGDLVESTNSRQREEKAKRELKTVQGTVRLRQQMLLTSKEAGQEHLAASASAQDMNADADAEGPTRRLSDYDSLIVRDNKIQRIMLQVTKDKLWERIADANSCAAEVICM
jgi:hypothetical protein